jgi:CheY-like chemotaxis protein
MRNGDDEAKRLGALRRYRFFDAPRDSRIDELVALTAAVCDAPIALLGVLDADRVRILSCHGVDAREFERDDPLWRMLPAGAAIDVIPDLGSDPRLASHPLVAGNAHWRFAARAAVVGDDGLPLALLLVVDTRRRRMSDLQRLTLDVHARQLAALCELHRLTSAPRAAATEPTAPEGETLGAETAGAIDGARTDGPGAPDTPEESAGGEPQAPGPGEALIRRRILVVDDVEAAASLLGRVLESMGHETRIAHDGPKALAIAKEYRPDVILLDLGMPGMSGFVVARLLRAQVGFEGITLIAVTGHGRDEDRRQAVEAGFDHHLLKPVSAEHMRALLDQLPVQSQ